MLDTAYRTAADIDPALADPDRARLIEGLRASIAGAWTDPIPDVLAQLTTLLRDERAALADPAELILPATDRLAVVMSEIATRHAQYVETGAPVIGHRTGFPTLDRYLGGLDRGRMTVMLAGPGAGKTTMSNQVAATIAATGTPVLYVTFENSTDDLIRKQLARLGQVAVTKLRDGSIDPDTLRDAWKVFAAGSGRHLYYVQGTATTTVDTIRAGVELLADRYSTTYPVVMVDFLQRLALTGPAAGVGSGLDDMRGRVGLMAQRIRDMATELDCHVWAISSTNRQAYGNDKATPGIASGRESGDIEFAADAMISIARDTDAMPDMVRNTEPLQLKVVKNRHGDTGATLMIHRNRTSLHMAEQVR